MPTLRNIGTRGRQISEYEARLLLIVNSKTSMATQSNPVCRGEGSKVKYDHQKTLKLQVLMVITGDLNRCGHYRLLCLNAWPIRSNTIRTCDLIRGSV